MKSPISFVPSRLVFAVLLVGLFVCGPTAAIAYEAEGAPEERVVFVLAELAVGLESAGEECDRVAAAVRQWTDEYGDELPLLAQQTDARVSMLDPGASRRFDAAIAASMETIFTAAMVCSEHTDTGEALDALDRVLHGHVADKAGVPGR